MSSAGAARLFGLTPDELLQRGRQVLREYMDPTDRRRCRELFAGLCAANPGRVTPVCVEYAMRTVDGEVRRFSDSIKLVADDAGRLVHYGITSDVTVRWQAEQALRGKRKPLPAPPWGRPRWGDLRPPGPQVPLRQPLVSSPSSAIPKPNW